MSKRDLWEFHECHEAVTRSGIDQPCDRTAVALRIDPEEHYPYPVCARHSRNGGSRMVPLADVVRPVVEELDRIAAARDAAEARAEQAEQAVARVRAEVAEQIARALAAVPGEAYPEDVFEPVGSDAAELIQGYLKELELPSIDRISANAMRHAYSMAARIAREHAKGDGDD